MEQSSTIINLSNIPFSGAEVSLLSIRLSFWSTPCHFNNKEVLDNVEKYFRHLHAPERILSRPTGRRGRKRDEHRVSLRKQMNAS